MRLIDTFEVEKPTKAIIVLSQLDERYFRDLIGTTEWTLDFVVVKEGEEEPIAESSHSQFWQRSVNADIELEAGKYYVYVCPEVYAHFNGHTNLRFIAIDSIGSSGQNVCW